MERVVRGLHGFEDAERADRAWYASLDPQHRVDILLELVERYRSSLGEAGERFERVSRVVPLEEA